MIKTDRVEMEYSRLLDQKWPELNWDSHPNPDMSMMELIVIDDVSFQYLSDIEDFGFDEVREMILKQAIKIVYFCAFTESDESEPSCTEITDEQRIELLNLAAETNSEIFRLMKTWRYYINDYSEKQSWGDLLSETK